MSREEYKGAIEVSVIFHEGQRMFAVPKQPARPYRLLQDNGSKYFGESWDKAEQPAPVQQEPVVRIAELEETVRHLNHALREATEAPTFMGEPVSAEPAASIKGVDEYGPMLNWYTHWVNFPVGTKLYTSPQPAQQEPEAWMTQARCFVDVSEFTEAEAKLYGWKPLYTSPQPALRTWVGLTDKERNVINRHNVYVSDIISATEAKLKEKNNGN